MPQVHLHFNNNKKNPQNQNPKNTFGMLHQSFFLAELYFSAVSLLYKLCSL